MLLGSSGDILDGLGLSWVAIYDFCTPSGITWDPLGFLIDILDALSSSVWDFRSI